MNAELISTGSELLSGRTLNSHAQTLGAKLAEIGIRLIRDTSIPDDIETIKNAVAQALERTDLVFVSGGLGPTDDDLTRTAIAGLLDRDIERDTAALENIKRLCVERHRELTDYRARQADIVAGAVALPNPVGAAPGERIHIDGDKQLFILPGPPPEFSGILDHHVLPWIKAHDNDGARSDYIEKIFLLCGLAEADILQMFDDARFPPAGIDIAYCAGPGQLEIRLSSPDANHQLLEQAEEGIKRIVGDNLFADQRTSMEEVVGSLLRENERTLAVAESCTGGLLGARITAVPGSSSYFPGGIISYSNQVKIDQLGVNTATLDQDGAVSPAVAEEMARGVRDRFNADYGIGITGIAGPGGGTEDKPVGLVYIALADSDEVQTARFLFGQGRQRVRRATTQMALDMLRRKMIHANHSTAQ